MVTSISQGVEKYFPRLWGTGISDAIFSCCCSSREFNKLIEKWMLNESKGETSETHPWKISKHELSTQKDKVGVSFCVTYTDSEWHIEIGLSSIVSIITFGFWTVSQRGFDGFNADFAY